MAAECGASPVQWLYGSTHLEVNWDISRGNPARWYYTPSADPYQVSYNWSAVVPNLWLLSSTSATSRGQGKHAWSTSSFIFSWTYIHLLAAPETPYTCSIAGIFASPDCVFGQQKWKKVEQASIMYNPPYINSSSLWKRRLIFGVCLDSLWTGSLPFQDLIFNR